MKPVAKLFTHKGQFWFDVVDEDDNLIVDGHPIPEHLFTSKKGYTREQSAEDAANRAVEEFRKASEQARRAVCGYDSDGKCGVGDAPIRRVGNRNNPVRVAEPTDSSA